MKKTALLLSFLLVLLFFSACSSGSRTKTPEDIDVDPTEESSPVPAETDGKPGESEQRESPITLIIERGFLDDDTSALPNEITLKVTYEELDDDIWQFDLQ